AKQIINLLLLSNNFYPVISYRRVQKESGGLLCTVWSLVMVRKPVASARDTFPRGTHIFVTSSATEICEIDLSRSESVDGDA
ncbi:unnamed protein product, partial [Heterotrigona itama]